MRAENYSFCKEVKDLKIQSHVGIHQERIQDKECSMRLLQLLGIKGSNEVKEMEKTAFVRYLNFKYSTLEKATGSFDSGKKIGQGGFGTVYELLRCSCQGPETLLDYDLQNKILDRLIFDMNRGKIHDWPRRFMIIDCSVKPKFSC